MSRVIYDKDQEKYFRQDEDGNLKELLRVTQLLAKHGLSVNYDDVPEHIMESARIFGDIHHAWLDKFFKGLASEEDLPDITKERFKNIKDFWHSTLHKRTKSPQRLFSWNRRLNRAYR